MPRVPKGQRLPVPARKNCACCGRWLLTCINFRVRAWLEDGSRPIGISSNCNICHARYNNSLHVPKITKEVLKIRRDEEFFVLHNKLDAAPFRSWLQQRVQEIGIGNVASAIGVDPRRIAILIEGRYVHNVNNRTYEINYVQLQTVDVYTVALGYHWDDIYPNIAQLDRSVVRQRLWRKGEGVHKKRREESRASLSPITIEDQAAQRRADKLTNLSDDGDPTPVQ